MLSMPSHLTEVQKRDVTKAWARLAALSGYNDLGFDMGDLLGTLDSVTTKNQAFWCDVVNGKDSNDGSPDRPFKTIGAAVSRMALEVLHSYTIYVKPGTYPESVQVGVLGWFAPFQGVSIQGTDWTTLHAGGTVGSVSGRVVNVTGMAWTVNQWIGKFLKVGTSYYPISANAAASVTLCKSAAGITGAVSIVEPAAVITSAGDYTPPMKITCITGNNFGVSLAALKLASSTNFNNNLILAQGQVYVQNCLMAGSSDTHIQIFGSDANLYMQDSAVLNTAANAWGIYAPLAQTLVLDSCLLEGGGTNGEIGVYIRKVTTLFDTSTGNTTIQNWTAVGPGQGVLMRDTGNYWVAGAAIVKSCYNGVKIGKGNVLESAAMVIDTMTTYGLQLGNDRGGGAHLRAASGITIQNCANGLLFNDSGNSAELGSGSVISSCSVKGVNLGPALTSSHNRFTSTAAITMASNGADFSIDGTATKTLAQVQGLTNKNYVEATLVLFNSIHAE